MVHYEKINRETGEPDYNSKYTTISSLVVLNSQINKIYLLTCLQTHSTLLCFVPHHLPPKYAHSSSAKKKEKEKLYS